MFHNYVNVVVPGTKCFNALAIYCGKVSSIHNKYSQKTMAGGYMHDRVASYFINQSGHFPYILYEEREQADPKRGVAIIT